MVNTRNYELGEYFWFVDKGIVKEGKLVSKVRHGVAVLLSYDEGTFPLASKDIYETEKDCRRSLK